MPRFELPDVHPDVMKKFIRHKAEWEMGVCDLPVFDRNLNPQLVEELTDEFLKTYLEECGRYYGREESVSLKYSGHLAAAYFEAVKRNDRKRPSRESWAA